MSQLLAIETDRSLSKPLSQPPLIGDRLREFAYAQLTAAEKHLESDGEILHSGIHQCRKSLRRARAVLALGESVFDHRAAALDSDLGRLCRGLSPIRDAQALIDTLERLHDAAPETRSILPQAIAAARKRRDGLLQGLLTRDLDLLSRRNRIHAMRERIARLDWRSVDEESVRHALSRSERRAVNAELRAERRKDDGEIWHRFRRRLRRLHQQRTLLLELAPNVLPSPHPVEKRADALSEAQDDTLLLARCRGHSPFQPEHRALLRVVARRRLKRIRG
jgi:CHAD domain-containing protein